MSRISHRGLLVTNPTNIRYKTGFVGVAPDEREAYVLLAGNKKYLFTNALYLEQSKKLDGVELVQISRESPFARALARIIDEIGITTLEFEENNLTVFEYTKLNTALAGVKFMPSNNRIEEKRLIKRPDEIRAIQNAATLTDECFAEIVKKLKPGITETEIAWEIDTFFRQHDADNAFSPIVAFGNHTSMPHYMPTGVTKLQKNDIMLLDFAAKVNGYCADMTRMIFVGKPMPQWIKAYEVVLASNDKALQLLASGERHGATLDAAAKEVIAEADFPPYPHSLGHAVGLEIHEAPRLSTHKDEILHQGMVVTVEPGTYIEGQFGIRIENLVYIKKTGIELLSKSPTNLAIL